MNSLKTNSSAAALVVMMFAAWRALATDVCGDISGVWDSTGSPYYVTCDVTVPAGQTLQIGPGVQVLFTGHYKFNVFGNLQAIGTEQDSIVFTRAFPTEESKWWGIRFQDSSDDSSRLDYCVIEYGLADSGPAETSQGGGLIMVSSSPTISRCTIRNCWARNGGGIATRSLGSPLISDCRIESNTALEDGGGLAFGNSTLLRCVIVGNHAGLRGGSMYLENPVSRLINCTLVDNSADSFAAGIAGNQGIMCNSIVWANTGPDPVISASLTATYSNIQGGYPGTGNINADPLFVDAANGDFHLQPTSPCIDTGDPNSPLDPDSTRADMGAFPFYHVPPPLTLLSPNGGEEWTIFSTQDVTWTSYEYSGDIMIELNRDYPNGEWEILDTVTANDGSEAVEVTPPLSINCRVRLSAVEDTFSDISDGSFSITSSEGFLAMIRDAQPNTTVLSWNAGTIECPLDFTETFRLKNFGNETVVVFRPQPLAGPNFFRTTSIPVRDTLDAGEVTADTLTLTYDPASDGTHSDTLLIQTDAENAIAGVLKIPLTGTRIITPSTPEVVITAEGNDAVLYWDPVSESVGGCAVNVTGYLVFYSGDAVGPYWYHGFTADTSYTHVRVIQFNYGMFYEVVATTAALNGLLSIPTGSVTKEELLLRLR